jgi:hypothetical protein
MAINPYTPRLTRPMLHPGQAVHVNAHSAWLDATVTHVGPTAVGIRLSGQVGVRTRTVTPWVVRPADGYRLAGIGELRHGDQIVAADATVRTLAGPPWQGRDGWWVLTFADTTTVSLPAGAILRLVDDTPTVSVDGVAITAPRYR